jgi:hypothetical protein
MFVLIIVDICLNGYGVKLLNSGSLPGCTKKVAKVIAVLPFFKTFLQNKCKFKFVNFP